MDCSPPGPSVHGIFQAGVLEWNRKYPTSGNSRAVQWLGLCGFTAEDLSSITSQGKRTPQAVWQKKKKKKRHRTWNPSKYFPAEMLSQIYYLYSKRKVIWVYFSFFFCLGSLGKLFFLYHSMLIYAFAKWLWFSDILIFLYNLGRSDQIRSVAQSCLTLCDTMNRSTPGLPVHHQLPEFTQTHVHRVSDAIQPSHPLSSPFPLAPNPS